MVAVSFAHTSRSVDTGDYARRAYLVDACVHAVTVAAAILAAGLLAVAAFRQADLARSVALMVYGESLLITLGLSASYNLNRDPGRRERLRCCDHAGIFALIAGTYTPLTVFALGAGAGGPLLMFMWIAAAIGATVKLRCPGRFERIGIATYLALGWAIFPLLGPLSRAMTPDALWLLCLGGIVYTIGVGFHLAHRVPYHTAIWHVFVLAGAACHFLAIYRLASGGSGTPA